MDRSEHTVDDLYASYSLEIWKNMNAKRITWQVAKVTSEYAWWKVFS